jgi:DNA-binding Lrp family transcriptional regulator
VRGDCNSSKKAGVIRGYSADIDATGLGFLMTVLVHITLDRQNEDALAAFTAVPTAMSPRLNSLPTAKVRSPTRWAISRTPPSILRRWRLNHFGFFASSDRICSNNVSTTASSFP